MDCTRVSRLAGVYNGEMKYFLVLFLLASTAGASEIILDRTNKMGARKVDILKHEKGVYYFNGKSLGKTLPPKAASAWKALEKGPAPQRAPCVAGTYTYIYKNKNENRREGCAEGIAYGDLISHIETLRTHARGL